MPFLLPESPATDYICVQLEIPNTQQDIRNFMGQLVELAQWFRYERTGDDLGAQVAQTWLPVAQNTMIGTCMEVRQNPGEPCKLEYSLDQGTTWVEYADITTCITPGYLDNIISANQALQQTIAYYSNSSAIIGTTPANPGIEQTSLLQGQACDFDNVFGLITGLTDLLYAVSSDIFEILVTAPNAIARLGDLIEAIPGIGELPLDDAFQFMEEVANDIRQAFEAAYTTQLRDEIRCDLFCLAKSNCDITIEEVSDYFFSKLTNAVTETDFIVIINDILANNWVGTQSVYVMHWFIMRTIIFGGEIGGIDVNRLTFQVAALWNDPDPDWAILCSCSTTYFVEIDFSISNGGFTAVSGNRAVYSAGSGWIGANDGTVTRDYIRYSLPTGITITNIEARISRTPSRPAGVWTIGLNKSGVYSDYNSLVSGSSLPYPTYITWTGSRGDAEIMVCDINSSQGTTTMLNDRIRMTFDSETGIPAQLLSDGWTEYTP